MYLKTAWSQGPKIKLPTVCSTGINKPFVLMGGTVITFKKEECLSFTNPICTNHIWSNYGLNIGIPSFVNKSPVFLL